MEQSFIELINDKSSYVIITDGKCFFIPGRREDDTAYLDEFDTLAYKYLPHFDTGLGSGWLFDRVAIETLKKDFELQQVCYAEIKINSFDLHF